MKKILFLATAICLLFGSDLSAPPAGPGKTQEEKERWDSLNGGPGLSGGTSSGGNGNVWVPPAGFVEPGVVNIYPLIHIFLIQEEYRLNEKMQSEEIQTF